MIKLKDEEAEIEVTGGQLKEEALGINTSELRFLKHCAGHREQRSPI